MTCDTCCISELVEYDSYMLHVYAFNRNGAILFCHLVIPLSTGSITVFLRVIRPRYEKAESV